MKISHSLFVCAVGVLLAPPLLAAPIPEGGKNPGPQISIQAQSIDHVIDKVKKSLKAFVPAKEYDEMEKELLGALDTKNLPGLDPKRPFGFYSTLDAGLLVGNFEKSVAVLMVPITSEKEFLALLEKGKIPVEKKDGFYAITVPNFPVELSMRFHKEYAYVGFAGTNLEPKFLLDPREVISSKETAALLVKIRIDQVPQELKDAGIDLLEKAFDEAKNTIEGGKRKDLLEQYLKLVLGWYKMGLTDGHELIQRMDLDAPTGEIVIEMTLDGKPKSKLAKSIAGIAPTKNDFLGIVGKDSVGHVLAQMPLFSEDLRSLFSGLSDLALEAFTLISKGMPEEAAMAGTEAIKALGRTLKSGDMDLAASLRGPNKDGLFTAIGAIRLKDTAALEKALRGVVKIAPEKFQKALKLDAGKIDGIAVHELDFADEMPPELKKAFGKNAKLYVLLAPNALYLAFGADGMSILTDALTAKGGSAPLIHAEINAKRLGQFIKTVADPKGGQEYFDQLAKLGRMSVFTLDVSGGEKLSIKYTYGAVPMILWLVPRGKSATFQPVVPPAAKAAPPAKE